MKTHYKFTCAADLTQQFMEKILPFWHQTMVQNSFESDDGFRIHYGYCLHPSAKGCIVLSPGRTESYLKYQEFIFDLYQNGFSVFAIDHRGQGLSARLLDHPHKGYVDDFQHYVDDFRHFYLNVVTKKANAPLCLVGHSMGSTIATLYLQQHPYDFVAAAMSAPLYGFKPGPAPLAVSRLFIRGIIGIKALLRQSQDYFYGQCDYTDTPFTENELTHCKPRYEQFRQLYAQTKQLRLGGVTFHWVATTLRALERLFAKIERIKAPFLLIQSCDDGIVNQAEQNRFYRLLQQYVPCQKVELHGARHEVFFETDLMRTRAMHTLIAFFEEYCVVEDKVDCTVECEVE